MNLIRESAQANHKRLMHEYPDYRRAYENIHSIMKELFPESIDDKGPDHHDHRRKQTMAWNAEIVIRVKHFTAEGRSPDEARVELLHCIELSDLDWLVGDLQIEIVSMEASE